MKLNWDFGKLVEMTIRTIVKAYYGVLLNVHRKIDDIQGVPPNLSLKQLCGNTFSLFLVDKPQSGENKVSL